MKLSRALGATSQILQIKILDKTKTDGSGLTGLTNASGSLTAYYHRDTDTTATAISLVTMTVGTFTSSGFKEIDATNMPGWYQLCPPNACFASGASSVGIMLKGAANMADCDIEIDLASNVIAGTVSDKTGYILASTGLAQIVPTEPTQIPTWGTTSLSGLIAWITALSLNKKTQTSSTAVLRNYADSGQIAQKTVADDTTTLTDGRWT